MISIRIHQLSNACNIVMIAIFLSGCQTITDSNLSRHQPDSIELGSGEYQSAIDGETSDREILRKAAVIAQRSGQDEAAVRILQATILLEVEARDYQRIDYLNSRITSFRSSLSSSQVERFKAATAVNPDQRPAAEELALESARVRSLLDQSEIELVINTQERLLSRAKAMLGDDHWLTISARIQLFKYLQIAGRSAAEIRTYYNTALASARSVLGEAHPKTIEIQALEIDLLISEARLPEAIEAQFKVVDAYSSSVGEYHQLTISSRFTEVDLLRAANRWTEAAGSLHRLCTDLDVGYGKYYPESIFCLGTLAKSSRASGELQVAVSALEDLTARQSALGQSTGGTALNNILQLADVYRELGEYDKSRDLLLNVQSLEGVDPEALLIAKTYLARLYNIKGQFDLAEQLTLEVLESAGALWQSSPEKLINISIELASIYQNQGRLDLAEATYEGIVYNSFETLGQFHASSLVALANLGQIYELLGKFDLAGRSLEAVLESFELHYGADHPNSLNVRNNLALVYESEGNFREAEPLYQMNLARMRELKGDNHTDTLATENNLAYLYMLMEKYEQAIPLLENARNGWQLMYGAEHQKTLKAANNLARVYQRTGESDKAMALYQLTLAQRQRVLGPKHLDSLRSMIDLGSLYIAQSQLDEAEALLVPALDLCEELLGQYHPYTFDALNQLADLFEEQGDLPAALQLRRKGFKRRNIFLNRMLWIAGENSRESYIRVHQTELADYIASLVASQNPKRGEFALEVSLERKGLLLRISSEIEQISQLSLDPAFRDISLELDEIRNKVARQVLAGVKDGDVASHFDLLYELEQHLSKLQVEIAQASALYSHTVTDVSIHQLSRSMPEDTALVDFLMYEDSGRPRLLATVMTKQAGAASYQIVEFKNRALVEQSILAYRTVIQDQQAEEDELLEIGAKAFTAVWQPLQEALDGLTTVYVIPDGVLNILPFDALVDSQGKYLIETYLVNNLTSARDLVIEKTKVTNGEYVVFSGPDYNAEGIIPEQELRLASEQIANQESIGMSRQSSGLRNLNFSFLPGAVEEGQLISEIIRGSGHSLQYYSGRDAQEIILADAVEAPELLHIATHGFFLEQESRLSNRLFKSQRSIERHIPPPMDNPLLRAGLVFAGINVNAPYLGDIDNRNDGILTAMEILALKLNGTQLVVLSACETGLGEIHEGEGVYGLRRSFQEAGALSVISSLWQVSDAGTREFMANFYDRLMTGKDPRTALREVQLALLKSPVWGTPYIWSAFMIVGGA